MNKFLRTNFAVFLFTFAAVSVSAQQGASDSRRVFTAADYDRAAAMLAFNTAPLVDRANVRPTFLPDGRFYYQVKTATGNEYVLINPSDGKRTTAATLGELNLSPATHTTGKEDATVSPDGRRAAFIKDYNLRVRDLQTNKETQLTTDGVKDYGYATDNAGWTHSDKAIVMWSPDSKKIATFQQDQRKTGDMYLVSTNVGHPTLEAWKYPLPGDKDVTMIERVVIDVDNAKVIRFQMPPDEHRTTLCDDISCNGDYTDVEWSADAKQLMFASVSRDHKNVKLRVADTMTGAIREVYEETSPTQFESGIHSVNWRFLPASNEFIWFTERDGWGHLFLYDLATGKLKNQITTGDFPVWEINKVDEQNRRIYFTAGGREKGEDPYFGHFYSVDFAGKNIQLLTPESGNHDITIAPDGKTFIDSYSTPNTPNVVVLRDLNGKLISTLEKTDISRLTKSGWKPPTPVTVKSNDGKWDLYGLMFTPTNLDPSKKYPVINYIYPGPQGGAVGSRSFAPARSDHQALAELGFVVVEIDGSCNPQRSKAFHDVCYGNMADNTLADQIAGMKQLAEKYPYIDLNRVGIWGHSGGGFATAAAMFRYPDFFKVGISESGNHDNRNYEDDWGERYIGLEVDKDGKPLEKQPSVLSTKPIISNYENQANQNFAANLKGKLLLAHGTMDDNVPPSNTLLVVDALIKANKDFDLILIPNARHGYGAASSYMMRRRWDYFVKNLLGATPPDNYEIKTKQGGRMPAR